METAELRLPAYDPAEITVGVVHFGIGNFHRSHQAMYLDRLITLGGHDDWGIIGVGVMPGDKLMRDSLAGQGYRYTLVEKAGDGRVNGREIASIRQILYAPEDPQAVIDLLIDPGIRIVSLTITEGGYNIDRATGEFDLDNPFIQRDLTQPHNPATVFGYITEALRIRYQSGITPFTVMSCDNLPGNGDVMRQAILTYAGAIDGSLASWISDEVAFPSSMVDRITPVTTDADRTLVKEIFGVDDAWPVVTEPFTQWVLEEQFCNARPNFELAGVQMTDDVAPYELMKLRLLNASHQAMAYIGTLFGYTHVHEAVDDSDIGRFLRAYLDEARVTLSPLPGVDVDDYIETLFDRFRNPYIADTLARLAVDASDRIPKFVLPALQDNLAAGRPIDIGAAVVASWAQYLAISTGQVADPMAPDIIPLVHSDDPLAFIQHTPIFGTMSEDSRFAKAYTTAYEAFGTHSLHSWIKTILVK